MTSKMEKDKTKQLQDKCQSVLNALLRDEDNKYCVDCDSKGPRWASWNIGVFLCIRCAGIHRNLGVHISRVKSVNLDSWTPEQVVSLQQMGNSRARAVYEANLPDNFRRPQNDLSLETFIRAKYEHKKYIAREWVPPPLPKVNWEKEIEEEMEKQKKKTKTIVEKKPLASVEVPQLPKPKNPSPKPSRLQNTQENKKDNDLLGLQNGDDSFSNFLSGPTSDEKKTDEKDPIKSEEESFFSQTIPTEKEKVKLSKDSILSLYGKAPVNNFNQLQNPNPLGQVPYPSGFPLQTNFQGFSNFPQQNYPSMQFPMQQFPSTNQFPVQTAVNHFTLPAHLHMAQNHLNHFQSTSQIPVSNQFGQFPQQNVNVSGQPNPFYSTLNLQQQLGNLSLGNQSQTNQTQLASNVWQ